MKYKSINIRLVPICLVKLSNLPPFYISCIEISLREGIKDQYEGICAQSHARTVPNLEWISGIP